MRARLADAGIPDPVVDSIVREHEALRCRFPLSAVAADLVGSNVGLGLAAVVLSLDAAGLAPVGLSLSVACAAPLGCRGAGQRPHSFEARP